MDANQIYSARYKAIVCRLVEARTKAELTQTELASQIGLGQPEVSRIENFQRQITVTELMDWIEATASDDLLPVISLLTAGAHAT